MKCVRLLATEGQDRRPRGTRLNYPCLSALTSAQVLQYFVVVIGSNGGQNGNDGENGELFTKINEFFQIKMVTMDMNYTMYWGDSIAHFLELAKHRQPTLSFAANWGRIFRWFVTLLVCHLLGQARAGERRGGCHANRHFARDGKGC